MISIKQNWVVSYNQMSKPIAESKSPIYSTVELTPLLFRLTEKIKFWIFFRSLRLFFTFQYITNCTKVVIYLYNYWFFFSLKNIFWKFYGPMSQNFQLCWSRLWTNIKKSRITTCRSFLWFFTFNSNPALAYCDQLKFTTLHSDWSSESRCSSTLEKLKWPRLLDSNHHR